MKGNASREGGEGLTCCVRGHRPPSMMRTGGGIMIVRYAATCIVVEAFQSGGHCPLRHPSHCEEPERESRHGTELCLGGVLRYCRAPELIQQGQHSRLSPRESDILLLLLPPRHIHPRPPAAFIHLLGRTDRCTLFRSIFFPPYSWQTLREEGLIIEGAYCNSGDLFWVLQGQCTPCTSPSPDL